MFIVICDKVVEDDFTEKGKLPDNGTMLLSAEVEMRKSVDSALEPTVRLPITIVNARPEGRSAPKVWISIPIPHAPVFSAHELLNAVESRGIVQDIKVAGQ